MRKQQRKHSNQLTGVERQIYWISNILLKFGCYRACPTEEYRSHSICLQGYTETRGSTQRTSDSHLQTRGSALQLPNLPPLLYKCAWSSAVNTYAGAKDALNIVEAWIRKREKKKKPQQISPNSTSTVLLTMSTVNPLTLKITYTWSIEKK